MVRRVVVALLILMTAASGPTGWASADIGATAMVVVGQRGDCHGEGGSPADADRARDHCCAFASCGPGCGPTIVCGAGLATVGPLMMAPRVAPVDGGHRPALVSLPFRPPRTS